MREFKFRAWDSYFKSFTGFIIEKDKNNEDRIFFKKANHYSDYCLGENKTRFFLMQYTGLKDKNGKEIYEGDIVKYKYTSREQIAEIKYNKEKLGFDFADNKVNLSYAYNFRQINNIEVIGNIYKNPELLKED